MTRAWRYLQSNHLRAAALLLVGCSGEGSASGERDASAGDTDAALALPDASVPSAGGSACSVSTWPASGAHTLDVAGTERSFIVELPAGYRAGTTHKLVLAWHGFTGSAARTAAEGFVGLEPLAQGDTIFVAGQGLDTSLLGQTAAGWDNANGRDIAFARALVTWLRAQYCIDDSQIFSVGISMGGYMSNQIGCEMNDVVRAVASIIGGGPLPLGGVQCTKPMAAFITHGTMDLINPFTAGQRSRDHWVTTNGCSTTSTPTGLASCVRYDGCQTGYPVEWCQFEAGHVVPDFAAEAVWSFFSQL